MNKISLLLFISFTSVTSFSKTYKIQMLNMNKNGQSMVISPIYLKIQPGDNIIFMPSSSGHISQSVFVPKKVTHWKGEESKEVSITLNQEGLYIYECRNHFVIGMAGIIQVGEAKNLKEAKRFLKTYKDKLVMNKGKLIKLLSEETD